MQVALALLLIALGIYAGAPALWAQLVINLFVAALPFWQSLVDPFWLWFPGDKPETVNALFYPSAIVAAASWVLLAFRDRGHDLALDRLLMPWSPGPMSGLL